MNSLLRDGLPLGLRFYDTLIKQKRYAWPCRQGYAHNEYQYTDNCTVPPWQIVRSSIYLENIFVTLVCVDTEEEFDLNTLCPDMITDITIETIGSNDYIIYKASHDCCALAVPDGLYYLKVEDLASDWYSELFHIDSTAEDIETFYRLWSVGQIRSIDDMDLRIWD